jgi:hypothetical protein
MAFISRSVATLGGGNSVAGRMRTERIGGTRTHVDPHRSVSGYDNTCSTVHIALVYKPELWAVQISSSDSIYRLHNLSNVKESV